MKYLLLCLVAAVLFGGCEGRNVPSSVGAPPLSVEKESSADDIEEKPKAEKELTQLEMALEKNKETTFSTGSNWKNMNAMGITAVAGTGQIVDKRQYCYPVTIKNADGKQVTVEVNSIYQEDNEARQPGENMRLLPCGLMPVGQDKVLVADAFSVRLFSAKEIEKEPAVLYSMTPDEGSIIDVGYDPDVGFLVIAIDKEEEKNILIEIDPSGREMDRTEMEAHFLPYQRLKRVNQCEFYPLGQLRYLALKQPVWVLEEPDAGLWSPETKEFHNEGFLIALVHQTAEGWLRIYTDRDHLEKGIACWECPGQKIKCFPFDSSTMDPNLYFLSEESWITNSTVEPTIPWIQLEAADLKTTMTFDFAAQQAKIEHHYTVEDLTGATQVCSSPTGNREIYLLSFNGMGDAAWGNYGVHTISSGAVEYLAASIGSTTATFVGEEQILLNSTDRLTLYSLKAEEPQGMVLPIPCGQNGETRWAVATAADEENQKILVLCREEGYDFKEDTVPASVLVYSMAGELQQDLDAGIRIPYFYKNYPYSPPIRVDGQGNLQIEDLGGQLIGSVFYLPHR